MHHCLGYVYRCMHHNAGEYGKAGREQNWFSLTWKAKQILSATYVREKSTNQIHLHGDSVGKNSTYKLAMLRAKQQLFCSRVKQAWRYHLIFVREAFVVRVRYKILRSFLHIFIGT